MPNINENIPTGQPKEEKTEEEIIAERRVEQRKQTEREWKIGWNQMVRFLGPDPDFNIDLEKNIKKIEESCHRGPQHKLDERRYEAYIPIIKLFEKALKLKDILKDHGPTRGERMAAIRNDLEKNYAFEVKKYLNWNRAAQENFFQVKEQELNDLMRLLESIDTIATLGAKLDMPEVYKVQKEKFHQDWRKQQDAIRDRDREAMEKIRAGYLS